MDFDIAWRYIPDIVYGLGQTALLSMQVVILGSIIAVLLVPLGIAKFPGARLITWLLINPFRILPVLVLMVWGFYSLPLAIGIRFPPWWIAVLCLSLNMAAFCTEIFRKAIQEVPASHVEAAQLIGFPKVAVYKSVIFPIAMRNASIPYLNQVLQTVKLTVLAAIISVQEVYHVTANLIQQTNRPLEMYTLLALATFIPLALLTAVVEIYEYKQKKQGKKESWHWISTPIRDTENGR